MNDSTAVGRTPRGLVLAGVLAMLGTMVAAGASLGADLGEQIYVRGFVSQGYLNTSRNNYLVPRSVNGTAEFAEAAITVSAQPRPRFRIGIQLLGRNFADKGDDQVFVDWAYGDYRLCDRLGLRAGKVKLPFGLYNEGRDVDMLRTVVFLPQSVYPEKIRDLVMAYEGAGAYGNLLLGGAGEIDYHVYGGTLSTTESAARFMREGDEAFAIAHEVLIGWSVDRVYGLPLGTSAARFRTFDDVELTFPWIWGGAVAWHTPLPGLRLSATFLNGRYHYRGKLRYDVRVPDPPGPDAFVPYTLEIDETTNIDRILALSAEFTHDDLTLAGEYYQDEMGDVEAAGWYASVDYRISRAFACAAYFAQGWPDRRDKNGERFTRVGLPDYYAWQQDVACSLRFDLTDFWLAKLEYHFIDGTAHTEPQAMLLRSDDRPERRWGMLAAKTTFWF